MSHPTTATVVAEMVEVVAPADLKGGYTFMAVYNGESFRVTVVS